MSTQHDVRIQELVAFATSEGLTLPYDPIFIITQEDLGNVVDLTTGTIYLNEADTVYTYTLTAKGEVLARMIRGEV